jgi:hypothetical protein
MTGLDRDTVVDLSFNKTSLTALALEFFLVDEDPLAFHLNSIALGKQIFNEETGEPRGRSNKFYILNQEEANGTVLGVDRLMLVTDSLGAFYPEQISIHREVSEHTLVDWLKESFPNQDLIECVFRLEMNAANGSFRIADLSFTPKPPTPPAT